MEFTGGMELATPVEKAATSLVEKATTGPCAGEGRGGGRRSGEGGSPDVTLGAQWRCRLAEQRRDGEREAWRRARSPRQREGPRSRNTVTVLQ
jgi:hypothetical protein